MKFKVMHKETGLFVIWDEESLEAIGTILQRGHRNVMALRGNTFYPLTTNSATVEEIEENHG